MLIEHWTCHLERAWFGSFRCSADLKECRIGVSGVVCRVLENVGIAAVFGLVAGCRTSAEPVLFRAEPSVVVQGKEVTVKLSGQHLRNSSRVDLDSQRAAQTTNAWSVEIGELRLGPSNVQLVDTQTLLVVVPGTLALGAHDVVVTTATGAHPTLHDGLTVVDESDASESRSQATALDSSQAGSDSTRDVPSAVVASETTSGETIVDVTTSNVAASGARDAGARDATDSSGTSGVGASIGSTGTLDAAPSGSGTGDVNAADGAASIGSSDVDAGGLDLDELRGALVHRYSFEDMGAAVLDSVSGADGAFVGGSLDGSGGAMFTGGGEYVDLPNGLISGRDAVTIEAWLIWDVPTSGEAYSWQRIFDFGSNSALEGEQGAQDTHLFLTPRSGGPAGVLHLAYRGNLTGSVTLNTAAPLSPGIVEHVAAVVDGVGGRMELYVDGASVATRDLGFGLSLIDAHNNWLGRSQVLEDPSFQGRILEFRVYHGVVSAPSLSASHVAGPDVAL